MASARDRVRSESPQGDVAVSEPPAVWVLSPDRDRSDPSALSFLSVLRVRGARPFLVVGRVVVHVPDPREGAGSGPQQVRYRNSYTVTGLR